MRHLFQTRAFIAVVLLLLLGAARCINACQLIDDPAAAAQSCHRHPAAAKKPCGQLAFISPDAQEFGEAPVTALRDFALALPIVAERLRRESGTPVAPGPLRLPLRI